MSGPLARLHRHVRGLHDAPGLDPAARSAGWHSLASLGTFPRTDFETAMSVKSGGSMLVVRALDAGGTILGSSAPVTLQD